MTFFLGRLLSRATMTPATEQKSFSYKVKSFRNIKQPGKKVVLKDITITDTVEAKRVEAIGSFCKSIFAEGTINAKRLTAKLLTCRTALLENSKITKITAKTSVVGNRCNIEWLEVSEAGSHVTLSQSNIKSLNSEGEITLRDRSKVECKAYARKATILNSVIEGILSCTEEAIVKESKIEKLVCACTTQPITLRGSTVKKIKLTCQEPQQQTLILRNCRVTKLTFKGKNGKVLLDKESQIEEVIGGGVEEIKISSKAR